jgi:CBS domain containing-hemolysin-like protein
LEQINLFFIVILIGLTAFFVASEFAIVKVRTSRIDQLIAEGKKNALAAKKVITHLDEYLSACQLGITITALGLGWLGEPTIEVLMHPVFEQLNISKSVEQVLSFSFAFAIVTFLHVVVGELSPKTFAIHKAEAITMAFAKPLILFYKIMFPFIWLLNMSARVFAGIFGLKPASEHEIAHSEEELRIILSESYERGEINQSEFSYVNNIFEFDNRLAREIMVPRTEIVALDKSLSLEEMLVVVSEEKFTRYPVVDGDKDNIIGIINIKELLTASLDLNPEDFSIEQFLKPAIRVIETIPIHDLLVKMQKEGHHMAILIDEYGGTAGLVTVEDILEEIVGEIRDEFDTDEIPFIRKLNSHHYLFDAKILIEDVNDVLGTHISDDDVDTLGGWILTQKYDVKQGDAIEFEGYEFTVNELDGHHILYIEVKKVKQVNEPAEVGLEKD